MIFKTIDVDSRRSIDKLAILGRSLSDIKQQISTFDTHTVFKNIGKSLSGNQNKVKVNAPAMSTESALNIKAALTAQDEAVKQGTATWESYFGQLKNGEQWQRNFVVNGELQTKTLDRFTAKTKAANIALKGLSMVGNALAFAAISMAIGAAVNAVDNYIHRVDNAKDALGNSLSSYKSTTEELEALKEESNECTKSIKALREIEHSESLSVVEQQELDTLIQQNDELQRKIALKKQLAQVNAKQVLDDAEELLDTTQISKLNYKDGSDVQIAFTPEEEMQRGMKAHAQHTEQSNKLFDDLQDGEITQEQYIKRAEEIGDLLRQDKDTVMESYATINQAEQSYQTLIDTGYVLSDSQKDEYDHLVELGNAYLDFNTKVEHTAVAFDELTEQQKRHKLQQGLMKLSGEDISLPDAKAITKHLSEHDMSIIAKAKVRVDPPDRNDYDSADEWGRAYGKKWLEAAQEEIDKVGVPKVNTKDALTSLEEMSKGFDAINTVYQDVADGGEFDFGSLIDKDFIETFGNMGSAFDDFLDVVSNSPDNIAACQSSFDSLVSTWLYAQDPLKNITNETFDLTVAWLEQQGIANANEIATYALARSKDEAFLSTCDLRDGTVDEILAMMDEAEQAGISESAMYALQAAMIAAQTTPLNFSSQIDALYNLAMQAGIASSALANVTKSGLKKQRTDGSIIRAAAEKGMDVDEYIARGYAWTIGNMVQKPHIPKVKTSYKPPRASSGGSGSKGGGGGGGRGSSPKKSAGSQKEPYVADINKYKDLEDAISAVQDQISDLDRAYSATDDIEKQIHIKEQLIPLYQKEKDAIQALNDAKDKEIKANVDKLKAKGFQIDYDPTKDYLHIKNREHLNKLSQDIIKDYESLIKETDKLNDENKKSADQWEDLAYKIEATSREIQELHQKQYEKFISESEHSLELLSNRKDTNGADLAIIDKMMEKTLQRWVELVKDGYDVNKDVIHELESEWMKYYDKRLEKEKELLESQLGEKDQVISAVIDVIDEQIKGIDEQIDAMKKLNEEKNDSLALDKAQAELDKARDQRTLKVLRKGKGFVYEADQDAIKEAQENLSNIKFENQINALEREKEEIEEYKNLWEELPDLYEKNQNKLIAQQQLGARWEKDVLEQRMSVYTTFKDQYLNIQDQIFHKTEELNKHINQQYLNMVHLFEKMFELMNTSSNTMNKSWYVNQNGQAPSQAQIGDKIYTKGGTYQITGKDPNGKFTSQKIDSTSHNIPNNMWGQQVTANKGWYVNQNGQAPSQAQVGDNIYTNGGVYRIIGKDSNGKFQSTKVSDQKNTITPEMWGKEVNKATKEANQKLIDSNRSQIDSIETSISATDNLTNGIGQQVNITQEQIDAIIDQMLHTEDNTNALDDATNSIGGLQQAVTDLTVSQQDINNNFTASDIYQGINRQELPSQTVIKQTATGGKTHGKEKSDLQKEYEEILKHFKDSTSKNDQEYVKRLEAAIAREEYGSGHTIVTTQNEWGQSHVVKPTVSTEGNMSAEDIKKKYQKSLSSNNSRIGELNDSLGVHNDGLIENTDTIHDASITVKESIDKLVTSNEKLTNTTNEENELHKTDKRDKDKRDANKNTNDTKVEVIDRHTSKSGNTEWVKVKITDPKTGKVKYKTTAIEKKAMGGNNLRAGVYNVDESGDELIVNPDQGRYVKLSKGSGVIPADVTDNLWKFGQNPNAFIRQKLSQDKISSTAQNNTIVTTNNYSIDHVDFPNVNDMTSAKAFVEEIARTLPQKANQYMTKR